jgi:MFS family permease
VGRLRALTRFLPDSRPLRVAPYRRLWLSTAVTTIGSQMTAVAVPKQIYDITGSSGWVGVSGLVALAPLLVFGIWGGAIIDAVDRRKLMLVTNSGIALTSLLFWAQAAAGLRSVWLVFVLLGLQQAQFGVNQSARTASIPRLIPLSQLAAATALGATAMGFGTVMGPMLAGALIPVIGLPTLYLLDSIGLVAAIWAVWRLPSLPPLDGATRRAGLTDVLDGFRYLATRQVLMMSMLADIIAMVLGMPRALFPEMAEMTFGDPPGGGLALGMLNAAVPAGALVGGLCSGLFTRVRRQGLAVVVGVCAWGVAVAAFGLAHQLWLALIFMGAAGAADMVAMVFRGAILQAAATDEMRGRIQGVFTVVVAGGPRLADLVHGTVGAAAGTTVAVTGGGVLAAIGMLIAAVLLPALVRYRAPAAMD